MTLQKAIDIIINRPKWMTYISLAFNLDLWKYRYVGQSDRSIKHLYDSVWYICTLMRLQSFLAMRQTVTLWCWGVCRSNTLFYRWTRQPILYHIDCGRLIPAANGDSTIPDSAETRLKSFCPPFVAAINLPHQGVVDSYKSVLKYKPDVYQLCKITCIAFYRTLYW